MNRKAFIAALPFIPSAIKAALAPKPAHRPKMQLGEAKELDWKKMESLYLELKSIQEQQEAMYSASGASDYFDWMMNSPQKINFH